VTRLTEVQVRVMQAAVKRPKRLKLVALPPPLERDEQENFFTWLYHADREVWEHAYAVMNSSFISRDRDHAKQVGGILQRQGVKAGYPDINIDYPVGSYHGLRLEAKRIGVPGPKPGDAQDVWHRRLRAKGYCVEVCHGAEAMKAATVRYLSDAPRGT
jgi:hypothetical protein